MPEGAAEYRVDGTGVEDVDEAQDASAIEGLQKALAAVRIEIGKAIVGQEELIEQLLMAVAAGGHVLLEGVPGLGKTLLVRTLAQSLDLAFARVQFTPDLMPADIIGTNVLAQDEAGGRRFRFQKGPLFAQVILADEINRATPKTQSALLEAMQERSATVGGQVYPLPEPFFVLATQNPVEMEGTYPLPEAQLDRFFFKLRVSPPGLDELRRIVDLTTGPQGEQVEAVMDARQILQLQSLVRRVPLAGYVRDYALRIVLATHPDQAEAPEQVSRYVRLGASPRGAQALVLAAKARAFLAGAAHVSFDDVRSCAGAALRHRILLGFEAAADEVTEDDILASVLKSVPEEAQAAS